MHKALKVGDSASMTRSFTADDVKQYADVSTDHNPVHIDAEFAASTQFGQRIVHGMFVGSMFSALLANELPGPGSIYMTQNLQFKAPVFFDTPITATVEITEIRQGKPIVTCKSTCQDAAGKTLIVGEAVMYVPWLKA